MAAIITALVQTFIHRYDLIDSDRMESPEQYEACVAAAKAAKGKRKQGRLRGVFNRDPDEPSGDGVA